MLKGYENSVWLLSRKKFVANVSNNILSSSDEISKSNAKKKNYINVLPVNLRRIEWASPSSNLSPIDALRCCSTRTNGVLPVDHTPKIKSVTAFKISN